MRAFITTVAGMATRFAQSLPAPMPKCIYTAGKPENTLLYRLVTLAEDFDRIVIVTGFMAEDVAGYVDKMFTGSLREKIVLVENKEYAEYGSGWSLYKGLEALMDTNEKYEDILFAEGDLYFSTEKFREVENADSDVITVNCEPILAKKAVALYFDMNGYPKYIYDTSHGALEIKEPFTAVYNSAQVWKLHDADKFLAVAKEMGEQAHQGTNLIVLNNYFRTVRDAGAEIKVVTMDKWLNCNTTADFAKIDF